MGCELMKCDATFSHELIKESPFFQISGDGLFTNRKVSNDRLNPTGTSRNLAIMPSASDWLATKVLAFAVSTGLLQRHPVRFLAHPLGPLLETHQ